MIDLLLQIVIAASALMGGAAALLGVSAWRRELQGRTEYDLARRVLAGVYKVRDRIIQVRAPMMMASEYVDRPGRENASSCDGDDLAFAYQKRWLPLQEAVSSLDVELLEAEAVWHDEMRECTRALRETVRKLFAAVYCYVDARRDQNKTQDSKFFRKLEKVIWPLGDPDEYGNDIQEMVASFENLLRPYLKR